MRNFTIHIYWIVKIRLKMNIMGLDFSIDTRVFKGYTQIT